MKKRLNIVGLLITIVTLIISLGIFWNNAIYIDGAGVGASEIFGGDFWLYMSWFRLMALVFIIVVLSMNILSIKNVHEKGEMNQFADPKRKNKVLISISVIVVGIFMLFMGLVTPLSFVIFGGVGLVLLILGIVGYNNFRTEA